MCFGTKTDVKELVQSYAEITQSSQKKVIEEASLVQSAKAVVEKVVQKLDTDKIEREKRKLKVVVMKVDESKAASAGQRRADDYKFCYDQLGMEKDDIDQVYRVGSLKDKETDYCRPLVIKLVDKECWEYYTDYGRGYKADSGFWMNADLCDADRRANFQAREQRRERLKGTQVKGAQVGSS